MSKGNAAAKSFPTCHVAAGSVAWRFSKHLRLGKLRAVRRLPLEVSKELPIKLWPTAALLLLTAALLPDCVCETLARAIMRPEAAQPWAPGVCRLWAQGLPLV